MAPGTQRNNPCRTLVIGLPSSLGRSVVMPWTRLASAGMVKPSGLVMETDDVSGVSWLLSQVGRGGCGGWGMLRRLKWGRVAGVTGLGES